DAMRRVWSLAGIAALMLGAVAPAAHAITPNDDETGEVRTLSVIPAAGRAEVIIGVEGTVSVQDFTLGTPPRVVLDVQGARLTMPPRLYDRVARGGVSNIRVAQ